MDPISWYINFEFKFEHFKENNNDFPCRLSVITTERKQLNSE